MSAAVLPIVWHDSGRWSSIRMKKGLVLSTEDVRRPACRLYKALLLYTADLSTGPGEQNLIESDRGV